MANMNWAVVKLILKGSSIVVFHHYDQNSNLSIDQQGVGAEKSLHLDGF